MSKRSDSVFGSGRVGSSPVMLEEIKEKLGPVIQVSVSSIKLNPKNKDFKDDAMVDFESFSKDIEENGIHDPLILRPDYTLLSGERRTLAARKKGIKNVPARIYYGDLSGENEWRFICRDNLHRRQLTAEKRDKLIARYYAKEINSDNRGKKTGQNLAKKVSREMGIPVGTAKRVIAKARKPDDVKAKTTHVPARVIASFEKAVRALEATWDRKSATKADSAALVKLAHRVKKVAG